MQPNARRSSRPPSSLEPSTATTLLLHHHTTTAARLTIDVLRRGNPSLLGTTFDVAWAHRWGRSSVGKEETVLRASRQDLVGDALDVLSVTDTRARHLREDAAAPVAA